MKTNFLTQQNQFFQQRTKQLVLLSSLMLLVCVYGQSQINDIFVPSAKLTLVRTIPVNAQNQSPLAVNANALYSNATNFVGTVFLNGGAANQAGNTITLVVADSLGLISNPPYVVDSYIFSVANLDAGAVSARPRIRFYANDGAGGGPGTLLSAISFGAISFGGNSIQTFNTGPLGALDFSVTTKGIWASITFDNNTGATGATAAQLNNLGQGVFNPIDRGVSTDDFFVTTTAGVFGSNPTGTEGNFGGSPLANFGWEVVSLTAPLPVTLNTFNAIRNGSVNDVSWSTSQEINTTMFVIERSTDGRNFTSIGQVAAAGNSSNLSRYQFIDALPAKSINYYRLGIVDKDNNIKFSDVKSVRNTGNADFSIYPNPVKDVIKVIINTDKVDRGVMTIADVSGKQVYNSQVDVAAGNNTFSVDMSNMPQGAYIIKVQLNDDLVVKKFTKM